MLRVVAQASRRVRSRAPTYCSGSSSAAPAQEVPLELYHDLADMTIESVQEVYEDFADASPSLEVDVESSGDVLNVTIGELGTFVLNKQAPNKQLWLSSPVSGPLRYDFCQASARWLNSRDKHSLLPLLSDDFHALVGEEHPPLDFAPVEEALRDALDDAGLAG